MKNLNSNMRVEFLADLQEILANYNYAIIKASSPKLYEWSINGDIDLAIGKQDVEKLFLQIQNHHHVSKIKVLKKSFMWQLYIAIKDDSLVALDLIFTFKQKAVFLLNTEELLSNKRQNEFGLSIASQSIENIFISLFYSMNGKNVSEKYVSAFKHLSEENKLKLQDSFNQKVGTNFQQFEFILEAKNNASIIRKKILEKQENKGIQALINKLNYMADSLKDWFQWDGIVITFSGVDGAGKSTIIENIKAKVEKQMRCRTVVIRHRPSLLPIISALQHGKAKAEQMSMQTLPRQGKNKSSISSLIRFAYYYFDYFVGQFYVQLKYVSRGYVVLYDRYYFDFVHDARRSNIDLSKKFTEPFYTFLLKPKLNFFLTAPADLILKRKQELSAETINELTAEYTAHFAKLSKKFSNSKYLVVNNIVLDETIDTIYNEIDQSKNRK
jgi:thymidylate kinase